MQQTSHTRARSYSTLRPGIAISHQPGCRRDSHNHNVKRPVKYCFLFFRAESAASKCGLCCSACLLCGRCISGRARALRLRKATAVASRGAKPRAILHGPLRGTLARAPEIAAPVQGKLGEIRARSTAALGVRAKVTEQVLFPAQREAAFRVASGWVSRAVPRCVSPPLPEAYFRARSFRVQRAISRLRVYFSGIRPGHYCATGREQQKHRHYRLPTYVYCRARHLPYIRPLCPGPAAPTISPQGS